MSKVNSEEYLGHPITDIDYLNKNLECMKVQMEIMCLNVQKLFVHSLEKYEVKKFIVDRWLREEGGGGITCVLQDGINLEKAGVNLSVVHGELNPNMIQYMKARGKDFAKGSTFFACGISSVIHPKNPHIPTVHFNYRYFCVDSPISENGDAPPGKKPECWWFGGGTDLTPYYLNKQDVRHFHRTLKNTCDRHDLAYYPEFKKICDEYFFIKHRKECRGVGGIFFDDLNDKSPQKLFAFIEDCAYAIVPSYIPILIKNAEKPYGEKERNWQLLRRGRYVEFNLIYDRGTKFGLTTPGARYESILMSLPLNAKWEYCHEPEPNSPEYELTQILKTPVDWLEIKI